MKNTCISLRGRHKASLLALAWTISGCMQPVTTSPPAAQAPPPVQHSRPSAEVPSIESNIVRVNKFFSSDPWLNFESDGTRKIDGVRFNVYLESAEKPLGVFGSGRMTVTMYQLDRDIAGKEVAAQIFEWDLPSEQAYPWRAKQKTALGWGYGFRLHWDPKLNVAGKQVAFVVKYHREDGRAISSSRQVVKVPAENDNGVIPTAKGALAAPTAPKPGTRRGAGRSRTAAVSPESP